ncbi:carboxypeptidase-like regulatory domain-containing protein [Nocardioides sp. LS1]|uniref:carboxypeptidase-like regulatory domain-containing protein n=1 Tax=Nocardioides sp. LS1 TaxID=1027620 RepID=UPI000F62665D|nr:carboxypeptidase-like regulatory domain-containing protein [Nocardioides sp. LS1]
MTLYGFRTPGSRGRWVGKSQTDAQGHYGVALSARDLKRYHQFAIKVDGSEIGYSSAYAGGGDSDTSAHRFTDPAALDPVVLERFSGVVRGALGLPEGFYGETSLVLYRWSGEGWDWTDRVSTRSSRYAFTGVAPGRYVIAARSDDWRNQRSYMTPNNDDAPQPVEDADGAFVVEGDRTVLPDLAMVAMANLRIALNGSSDHTTIEVYRWSERYGAPQLLMYAGRSGSDMGEVAFSVSPGRYAVRATISDGTTTRRAWYGGQRPAGLDDPATISVGSEDTRAEIDLGEPDMVAGRVVDSQGPVADADVTLDAGYSWCTICGHSELGSTTTDDQGRYTFALPDLGFYSYDTVSVDASADDQGLLPASSEDYTLDAASIAVDDLVLSLRDSVLRGVVSTADGEAVAGQTDVELWRWDDTDQKFVWFNEQWVTGRHYAFTGVPAGSYAVAATNYPWSSDQRYVTTWIGGTDAPLVQNAAGVVEMGEGGVVTAPALELSRGVAVSGTVNTPTGAPLADVRVDVGETHTSGSEDGAHLTRRRDVYATTDEQGHYEVRVAPDSSLMFWADRSGLLSHPAEDADAVAVAGEGLTHDLTMTPDWGSVGTVAGQQEDYCLSQQHSNETTFHDVPLFIGYDGVISVEDGEYGSLVDDSAVALAPLPGIWADQRTWGVSADGDTLCAQWVRHGWDVRTRGDFGVTPDGASDVVQAFVTAKDGGAFDVTYNYDTVTTASQPAGWADGLRRHGSSARYIPGWEDGGYRDGGAHALVSGHTDGQPDGRYVFHFSGLVTNGAAPDGGWTRIAGRPAVGSTLTAISDPWTIHGVETGDVDLIYTWLAGRDDTVVGSGATYTVTADDYKRPITVEVEGYLPGHRIAVRYGRILISQGAPAVTGLEPRITPGTPAYGDLLTAGSGEWMPGDGLAADDVALAYQWRRNGHSIDGATATSYQPTGSDAGQLLSVQVTATAPNHGTIVETSPAVRAPRMPLLTTTTEPSIEGTPQVGQTLTVDPGTWSHEAEFGYQWFVDGRSKGVGSTFTPDASDRGGYVTVVVHASAEGHRDGTASASAGPVIPADAELSPMTVHVRDADDQSALAGASVTACDEVTWTCLWGSTDQHGDFSGMALANTRYAVYVYPADNTHHSAEWRGTTLARGATTDVTVNLTKPTPPPANVSIPTSTWNIGGTPVVYWQQAQDFQVTGCAGIALPTYTVTFSDGTASRTAPLVQGTAGGDGLATYSASIPAFYPSHGDIVISTNVPADCAPNTPPTSVAVYIDPSGTITDQYGRPIDGATATLSRSDSAGGPFAPVPNGSPIMSEDNRANPSTTGANGGFQWDVTEGWYRVKAAASGCATASTDPMQVPPARVDLLVKLTCTAAAPTGTASVTGSPAVGSTLSTDTSSWGAPFAVAVQWLRDGQPIANATGSTYQVTSADAGHALSVRQTAQRPQYVQEGGRGAPVDFASASATSSTVAVPAAGGGGGGGGGGTGGGGGGTGADTSAPTVATVPTLVGSGKVDTVLTAPQPTWSLEGVMTTTQWYVDDAPIADATGATYTVRAADLGHLVSVRWAGALTGHDTGHVTGVGVRAVEGDAPEASVAPSVTGTALAGETLAATSGEWDQPDLAYAYQWTRDGAPITGADQATYVVGLADAHRTLAVTVRATRAGHAAGEAMSASVLVSRLPATATARLQSARILRGQVAHLTGRVRVDGVASPVGTVSVLDGQRVVRTLPLGAAKAGLVKLGLRGLATGVHHLRLRYVAGDDSARATSRSVRLVVTTKHHHRAAAAAAARPWVG